MSIDADLIVGIVATAAAIGALIYTGKSYRHESSRRSADIFSALLKEMSSTEASVDRRLVWKINDYRTGTPNVDKLRELVDAVRSERDDGARKMGAAAELTIARLDRVGFFLLADNDKPIIKPPIWLWTIVNDMWKVLGEWVNYRQNKDSPAQYYHKGYGYYFKKLAESKYNGKYWAK